MATRSRYAANGNARRRLREAVRSMGLPCALCGRPIDYSLPAGDPWSYELDEVVPVSRGGSELDPANVQPTHRICNERKGNRMPSDAGPRGRAVRRSRDW